jgi:hypothetical protein
MSVTVTRGVAPFCVSLTGADDEVSPDALFALQQRFPAVEWALLYFPEKEGQPRNPTAAWRSQFLDVCAGAHTALHLCGTQVFRGILSGVIPEEFSRYGRLQLNINARRQEFTDLEVLAVYTALLEAGHRLILQSHEATEQLIVEFLQGLRASQYIERIDVLFDASRGKGQQPEAWPVGHQFPAVTRCGYAGGLAPDNVAKNLTKIQEDRAQFGPYWLDMESGVRTDNLFDLHKVEQVLQSVFKGE